MATSSPTSPPVPKAILYYNPASVWASAALLALGEKGYGSDELELKVVDLKNGENFAPAYIRINPNGTVPALVVPLEKTIGAGIPNKYRALTDTKSVLEFLDKSRSAASETHTTSPAPAPALAPATIALSDISNSIISLLHSVPVNFLSVAASTPEGLSARAESPRAEWVKSRQAALQKYISEESEGANDVVKALWQTQYTENGLIIRLYGTAGKSESELSMQEKQEREAFFARSKEVWTGIKKILVRLEKAFASPYALGDQISLADLHIGAWLTRLLFVSGAPNPISPTSPATPKAGDAPQPVYRGFSKLAETVHLHTGDKTFVLGPKICAFWELMKERDSWRNVYADGLH